MIRKKLTQYLDQLENKVRIIDEFSLGEEISKILNAKEEQLTNNEELAEHIAFKFVPNYSNKETGWGTYYGPIFVLPDGEGKFVEFPSIQQINEDIIDYWKKRSHDSKHPILSCRYADLVFDFEPVVLKKKINFSVAQKVIDSTMEICQKNLDDGLGCKLKLERALMLAIKINDNIRIQKLKDVIIKTEDKFAEDKKPGIWGYSFKWLLLKHENKIILSEPEKKQLIDSLEQRLDRLVSLEDPDPWNVECAVNLLSEYYAKNDKEDPLKKVLDDFESAFRRNKYSNSDGMLISNYLEKLIEIYLRYSIFQFAKDARQRIVQELSNLGERGKFATKEISAKIDIKKSDINRFVKSIFGDDTSKKLEEIVAKIAVNFILRKKTVEDQLNDLAKNHPITYLVGHVLTSEDGFPIAKFSSMGEDYNKHLLENSSRNLHFHSVFLRIAFDKLKKRFSVDKVMDILLLSPVFNPDDKSYIKKLFTGFWRNDYLVTCCLCVPLIEDAIRNLYRINNQTFIKPNNEGGYDVSGLEGLLRQGLIKIVYQKLGEDVEYYLRVLLTERIGWNLRNNFAHGINKKLFENEDVANRLVHVLFCLALVRNKNPKI